MFALTETKYPPRPDSSFEARKSLSPIVLPNRPKTSLGHSFRLSHAVPEARGEEEPDDYELHPPVLPSPQRSPWIVDLGLSERKSILERPKSAHMSTLTRRENDKFSYRCGLVLSAQDETRVQTSKEFESSLKNGPRLQPTVIDGLLNTIKEGITGEIKKKSEIKKQVLQDVDGNAKSLPQIISKRRSKIILVGALSRGVEQGERTRIREYHGKGEMPIRYKLKKKMDLMRENPALLDAFSRKCVHLQEEIEERDRKRKEEQKAQHPENLILKNMKNIRQSSPERRIQKVAEMKQVNERKLAEARERVGDVESGRQQRLLHLQLREDRLVAKRECEYRRRVFDGICEIFLSASSLLDLILNERDRKRAEKEKDLMKFATYAFNSTFVEAGRVIVSPAKPQRKFNKAAALECIRRKFLPSAQFKTAALRALPLLRMFLSDFKIFIAKAESLKQKLNTHNNVKFMKLVCLYPMMKECVIQNMRDQWDLLDSARIAKVLAILFSSLPLSWQSLLRRHLAKTHTRNWKMAITTILMQLSGNDMIENRQIGEQLLDVSPEFDERDIRTLKRNAIFLPLADKYIDRILSDEISPTNENKPALRREKRTSSFQLSLSSSDNSPSPSRARSPYASPRSKPSTPSLLRKTVSFMRARQRGFFDDPENPFSLPPLSSPTLPEINYFTRRASRYSVTREIMRRKLLCAPEIALLTKMILPNGVSECLVTPTLLHQRELVEKMFREQRSKEELEEMTEISDLVLQLANIDDWRFRGVPTDIRDWLIEETYLELRRKFVTIRREQLQQKMIQETLSLDNANADAEEYPPILFEAKLEWRRVATLLSVGLLAARQKWVKKAEKG